MFKCIKHNLSLNQQLFSLKQFFSSKVDNKVVNLEKLKNGRQGIAVITLNDPLNKNTLSFHLTKEFNDILDDVQHDGNSRVLLVRSLVPDVFCAGANLKERIKMPVEEVPAFVSNLRNLTARLYNFPIPVIAAIDGVALGGGLELALSCDIRIASSNSKLGLVETRLAIIPGAGGTQYLPRIINPAIAKELIYTARVLTASQALNYGILNHVVEQNENRDAAFEKSVQIAEEILPNGPLAVKVAKKTINKSLEVSLDTGLALEEAYYAQVTKTKDRNEGLAAFVEKRPPKYIGE